MVVAMMEILAVSVMMGNRPMAMPVGMRLWGHGIVRMFMMPIVVGMYVFVLHRLMAVHMIVTLACVQPEAGEHERRRYRQWPPGPGSSQE